ncbi:MAG TPA: Na+/H+ antiporter NhaA, partial [Acidimicrobiales bacterium]|nr:Na+/H+ antiporter NhaA [Acidimicrobiales bacterium]
MAQRLSRSVRTFLDTEAAGGSILLVVALVALAWANSPWHGAYDDLWHTGDLRHWVNDGAMAVFFLVVGLEVKREVVAGELREWRRAALPVVAAAGGMVVPALLYAALNAGGDGSRGWGIPMATDIAFALGLLVLLGSRVPPSLKLFVLTLAVADDIGAIVVIAAFYGDGVDPAWLAGAAAALAVVAALHRA